MNRNRDLNWGNQLSQASMPAGLPTQQSTFTVVASSMGRPGRRDEVEI